MSITLINIFMGICLTTLMLPTEAVLVPHSAKLHRRLTFVAQAPPANWASASLEDYQQYHFRYLALGCNLRKGQTFFDTCCHPRLKTEDLKDIPLECNLDAESMVKALYILKSSDATGNITAGQEGKPVFIPNGTIRAIETTTGCNSSDVPTADQVAQLAEISRQISLLANSSHFANISQPLNHTMNSTDFGNLTYFLNSNISGLANITQFLPANLTRFFNASIANVTACKAVKVANHTDNFKLVVAPKELAAKNTTQLERQPPAKVADHSIDQKAADAAAAKAKADADSAAAQAKSDAEAKAAADAQATADAKGVADAKAASEAQDATQRAAAAKAASEKAVSDKATADKAAADQAAGDRTASDKAASDKAASDKAASDKAASDKAAADKAATDKAAADQAAADKAAADKAAAEKAQSKPDKYIVPDVGATTGNVLSGISHVFGSDGGAKATYFYQEGGIGACGTANSDSTPLVALPPGLYANGAHCGKDVMIMNTANGKSVTAKVQDMCPGCPSETSLDMSTGAYDAIGAQATGVLPIQWGFI